MLKLRSAIYTALLGTLAFAPGVQAGVIGFNHVFSCEETGDTNLKDYFCDGGRLYEVKVSCLNLDADIAGNLGISLYPFPGSGPVGAYDFLVRQNTDDVENTVCDSIGLYGNTVKTEGKCTDAPTGSNKGKPGNGNEPVGYDQASFEIKDIGVCPPL
jgi:hypothetical protein